MPANIDKLPFNVIDRCPHLEVVTFETEPFAFIPSKVSESVRKVAKVTGALIVLTVLAVGAVVLSRWAWAHPGQAITATVLLAFAGWGLQQATTP